MRNPSILVLEDDPDLRTVLRDCLAEEGFAVRTVATARALQERLADGLPDAIVLDIGLPDADGRDVCQALRAQGVLTPVLFLTAKDALVDRLAGFRAGGDDYLTKPFSVEELLARLRVLVRRTAAEAGRIVLRGLELDAVEHTATLSGVPVSLTPTEFRLLAALCARAGGVVDRRELMRAAWPHGAIVGENTLDAHVARLRRKLDGGGNGPSIVTVQGVGYSIR